MHPHEIPHYVVIACIAAALCTPARAQRAPPAPAVGIGVANRSIYQKNEFLDRIEAVRGIATATFSTFHAISRRPGWAHADAAALS